MTKNALVTGITGQDGAYLAKFLLEKGYRVFGTYRRLSTPNFWRMQNLRIFDRVQLIPTDLYDSGSVLEALTVSSPDEVYHLAAQSFVEASFETPVSTGNITGIAVTRILECIRHMCPSAKFYFAATSEMFGSSCKANGYKPLTEKDSFAPMSPYAAAKLYGYWIAKTYRESYKLYIVNGILFNHESPLRGLEFVTRKIANEVAKISLNLSNKLKLGNLTARRDWGYAPEYVEAMWLMLQNENPDDYIIATGNAHSVEDFVAKAFEIIGEDDWRKYVKVDKRFLRPLDVPFLLGDSSKAQEKLGWRHKVAFDQLVKIMVKEEIDRWSRWLKGESFPWDAPTYPHENHILTRNLRR